MASVSASTSVREQRRHGRVLAMGHDAELQAVQVRRFGARDGRGVQ